MKFHTKLLKASKIYGSTLVGTKGQIVIPVAARRDLKIKPGDSLIVIGKMRKALGLIKPQELGKLVELAMKHLDFFFDKSSKKPFEKATRKLLTNLKNLKP